MELKLNSYEIFEIGEYLENKLHEDGITERTELKITVTDDDLKKIDEDLFYRNNTDGKEHVPTEGEIIVNFKNLIIKIIEKNRDDGKLQ